MARKYTQEDFLKRAREIHGDALDFSEFKYVNSTTRSVVKCNVCGNVWMTRGDVILRGCGCQLCSARKSGEAKKRDLSDVVGSISEAIEIVPSSYIDTKHTCVARCKICGHEWNPSVRDLLNGHGCPNCYRLGVIKKKNERKRIREEEKRDKPKKDWFTPFVEKARLKHGDKYDYSKVSYENVDKKICIVCPKHGEFWQTPRQHLRTCGCMKCGIEAHAISRRDSYDEFMGKLDEETKNKFVFDESSFIKSSSPMRCICKEHGEFWLSPSRIRMGEGCQMCSKTRRLTIQEFVDKANGIHMGRYDYSKAVYVNNRTKLTITCPKHGDFEQTPNDHLDGCGCPKCKQSQFERIVEKLLIENKIEYVPQAKLEWLTPQSLDFYIPSLRLAIECQGEQHFVAVEHFGGEEKLERQIEYDERKRKLCEENGVELVYYLDTRFNEYVKEGNKCLNTQAELVEYLKNKNLC